MTIKKKPSSDSIARTVEAMAKARRVPVRVHGVEYPSCTAAGKALGQYTQQISRKVADGAPGYERVYPLARPANPPKRRQERVKSMTFAELRAMQQAAKKP